MEIGIEEVKRAVEKLSDIIIAHEVDFCDLDSAAGDGDFGMSLAKGFKAVKRQIDEIDDDSVRSFLKGCSMLIYEYCGGASGPIWGSAFGAAANSSKGKESLNMEDVALMFFEAALAIQKKGGATLGDKTLLDALIPAGETLKKAAEEGKGFREAFQEAYKAAEEGAEATKQMVASKGRASYLGERSLNHPDAGAAAIAIILGELLA